LNASRGGTDLQPVRLSFYCTTCLPGYHLPYLAAASTGLFADFGFDVELLDPQGGPANVNRVADGGADFCLTSIAHYLTARARSGDVAARFVAIVVQRSPMAALVAESSSIHRPEDLAGRRLGGPPEGGMVLEYQAALDRLGLDRSEVVPMDYREAWTALAEGRVDAVADYVDIEPRLRRLSGIPVRAIPFGLEVYSSGLVAADRLPEERVVEMRDALVAALQRQRAHPTEGVEALVQRYPDIEPAAAIEGWRLVEPYIFTDVPPGSMDVDRWADTIGFSAAAHGLPVPVPESVYRPELAQLAGASAR
jgi:NitT/TauT family transport system substrate-binding protein